MTEKGNWIQSELFETKESDLSNTGEEPSVTTTETTLLSNKIRTELYKRRPMDLITKEERSQIVFTEKQQRKRD